MGRDAELAPGSLIAGLRVESLIGRGGMGLVYRATQVSLQREVALKVVAPELAREDRFRERFLLEARLAGSLDHPHVLPVHDVGESEGVLYLVMRLVDGDSLAELLGREGKLDPGRASSIVCQLADALGAAHAAGLVHRDVKPANVLLTGGRGREHVYLADFGLARRTSADEPMTQPGGFRGTVGYTAPEQIRGDPVGPAADVYALGCVLFECLTGGPPFPRADELAVLWAHMHEQPPCPGDLDPTVAAFDAVVLEALAKDPEERLASAAAFSDAVRAAISDAATTAARSRTRAVTGLPTPATAFLGRERELGEVVELVGREDVGLLTLTGPGGTGKTRLALHAAAEVARDFPDGVFWVPLAEVRDPALVLATVAQTLDLKEQPGYSFAETLGAALTERRLLLLLDNAEHLLPDIADDVKRLLVGGKSVLLVTSRERLRLQGEQVYNVPPLDEPDGVALFLARAAQHGVSIEPDATVHELCGRLDHLPLAIELAAARASLYTPRQLLDRLGKRLDLLKGDRDADPRQATLRATIEWSYDLLSDEEQQLLVRLSIFAGGCTIDAAEQVCDADPDALQALLDKNLVRRRDADSEPRFWMLETIREFAAERLADTGDHDELVGRLLAWLETLAGKIDEGWAERDQLIWMNALEAERANLLHVVALAKTCAREADALQVLAAAHEFVDTRGPGSTFGDVLEGLHCGDPRLDGRALLLHGLLVSRLGHFRQAQEEFERAEALLRQSGDRVGESVAISHGHWHLLVTGDVWSGAVTRATDAVVLARSTGHPYAITHALNMLGSSCLVEGDYEGAQRYLTESIESAVRNGDRRNATIVRSNFLCAALGQQRPERGMQIGLHALEDARAFGDLRTVATLLTTLALGYVASEDVERAREFVREAVELASDLGDAQIVVESHLMLALAASLEGDVRRAVTIWSVSARMCREIDYVFGPETIIYITKLLEPLRAHPDFEKWWEAGAALPRDEALALGLGPATIDEPSPPFTSGRPGRD